VLVPAPSRPARPGRLGEHVAGDHQPVRSRDDDASVDELAERLGDPVGGQARCRGDEVERRCAQLDGCQYATAVGFGEQPDDDTGVGPITGVIDRACDVAPVASVASVASVTPLAHVTHWSRTAARLDRPLAAGRASARPPACMQATHPSGRGIRRFPARSG